MKTKSKIKNDSLERIMALSSQIGFVLLTLSLFIPAILLSTVKIFIYEEIFYLTADGLLLVFLCFKGQFIINEFKKGFESKVKVTDLQKIIETFFFLFFYLICLVGGNYFLISKKENLFLEQAILLITIVSLFTYLFNFYSTPKSIFNSIDSENKSNTPDNDVKINLDKKFLILLSAILFTLITVSYWPIPISWAILSTDLICSVLIIFIFFKFKNQIITRLKAFKRKSIKRKIEISLIILIIISYFVDFHLYPLFKINNPIKIIETSIFFIQIVLMYIVFSYVDTKNQSN